MFYMRYFSETLHSTCFGKKNPKPKGRKRL
jgi:hypothetical protein